MRIWRKLLFLFRRGKFDRDLEEEMRFHLEMNTDDLQLVRRTATRVMFDARMACKGMIILSQTFYPGWETYVDGHQAHLYEAYGVLQGVVVDGGSHRIEVRYRPLAVYLGGVLTTLGLVTALLLALPRAAFRLRLGSLCF